MKRIAALVLAVVMVVMTGTTTVSAAESAGAARLMPTNYYIIEDYFIDSPEGELPLGFIKFQMYVNGIYDLQGDNVISIDQESFTYVSGMNCESWDLEFNVFTSPSKPGYIWVQPEGVVEFGWTDPTTNIYFNCAVTSFVPSLFKVLDYT